MKQRVKAVINHIEIDGVPLKLEGKPDMELEFSAIDTGGGFHDPILDFAYTVEFTKDQNIPKEKQTIRLQVCDRNDEENRATFAYEDHLSDIGENKWEGMGRLKENAVSHKLVKFIMRAVR